MEVRFDGGSLVAGTVMDRLGLEGLIDEAVRPPGAGRGSGAKALSVVASMLVGGSFIDDADRLRAGSACAVLPFRPLAPSTLGTWLRSFPWGHVRQLDRACELALARAWSVGAAPAAAEVTVDLDSTVCEVSGTSKQGAAYGHTKVLGYHPVAAVRDDTGEMVHVRMRSGSSQRGHVRFTAETLARLGRIAPGAAVTVRADAGFFSYQLIDTIEAIARWTARLGQAPTPASSPPPTPSAAGCSQSPAAFSTTADNASCACPPTGHGYTPSPAPSNTSTACPCSSQRRPRGPAHPSTRTQRHQPNSAPDPSAPITLPANFA